MRMRGLEPPLSYLNTDLNRNGRVSDASAGVQIVRIVRVRGHIGRIWRGVCCQSVATLKRLADCREVG